MPRINESLYQGSTEVTFDRISKYKKYYTNTKTTYCIFRGLRSRRENKMIVRGERCTLPLPHPKN